jgi:phosphatidylinositol phospholipase C, delta
MPRNTRYTMVSPIPFRDVCQAIHEHAFVVSELPVVLSLEVHCSFEQQEKVVQVGIGGNGNELT